MGTGPAEMFLMCLDGCSEMVKSEDISCSFLCGVSLMYLEIRGTVETVQSLTSGESSDVGLTLSWEVLSTAQAPLLQKKTGKSVVRCTECSPESVALQMPGSIVRECAGASVATAGVST